MSHTRHDDDTAGTPDHNRRADTMACPCGATIAGEAATVEQCGCTAERRALDELAEAGITADPVTTALLAARIVRGETTAGELARILSKGTPAGEEKARLDYLRKELRAERLSWGDVAELQSLAGHIEPGDVELLEAAGVPEFPDGPCGHS